MRSKTAFRWTVAAAVIAALLASAGAFRADAQSEYMADDRRQKIEPFQILFGLGDAIGQPRNRHADIGGDHARAGAQRLDGPVGVMVVPSEYLEVVISRR